ncbi:UvrD-helicase domain-containing protein [Candidatus Nomurabacteria bacterium]|uniref:DNA 3'-5' helicase n=1 Tax=candidate division WWE3 bacterium TaxID=2053526 RepID=A0A955E0B6_UNCKA|nr:UvrD-helicase domain-containing protein [candidate division WWE3 bacterium]MCB9823437.1 UvrD-helicase domain-containing protein [Candidatus Nomurabacteria bacterium]MCB9827719.1 UvrD-helicase domain-containing protein [Candidatus Nomurabacteria bacterium]HXK52665.1 UvrD-helicase domain-containing protein [bacterium]
MDFLNELNEQQKEAALHVDGPALVVAGPGSGKTRVLTYRVANLIFNHGISPFNILCVTFTNKASGEINERVAKLLRNLQAGSTKLAWSGTFHSICAKILRIDGKEINIPSTFVIYDTDDQVALIKRILKDFGLDPKQYNPNAVLATISSAKSELILSTDYANYAQGYFQRTVARIYPEYQKRLRDNNALDFDDLLVQAVLLFEKRPEVLLKYQNKFKYILVDEYQDTNKAQYVLTKNLSNGSKNIFVVGDMSQAIYSFRGANYRNILNFQTDYPDARIFNLERNYRSTQIILDAAKSIIKNNTSHIELDLWTEKVEGDLIELYTADSEIDEAGYVVNKITEIVSDRTRSPLITLNDIAILYRTNAQSRNIEEQLIKNNIPYRIVGGFRFYARKEIKDITSYLKVLYNPQDTISWQRIINVPSRGIGIKGQAELEEGGWNLEEISRRTKVDFVGLSLLAKDSTTLELLDVVLDKSGYIKMLNDGTEENIVRMENIQELRSVATNFPVLAEFLENVALIESSDKPETYEQDRITLMTVHASKGLEFKYVFIVGMEENLFPHSRSLMELDAIEEERRLCYVAITRAGIKVFLTKAESRLFYGRRESNVSSRFLQEIPAHLLNISGKIKGKSGTDERSVDDFLDELDFDRINFSWE